jgi:hypothetical protein
MVGWSSCHIRLTVSVNTGNRSATWAVYSSGDHTSGAGRAFTARGSAADSNSSKRRGYDRIATTASDGLIES